MDVAAKNVKKALDATKNDEFPLTCALSPGGFSEAVYCGYSKKFEVQYLLGRKVRESS